MGSIPTGRDMLTKGTSCIGCPLYDSDAIEFYPPTGNGMNGVALVGDTPLKGRAVSVLDRILRKVGDRSEFAQWNLQQCAGMISEDRTDHCRVHRDAAFRKYRPKALVALGADAFRTLTGSDVPLAKARGYRFEGLDGIPVIPTYHPDFVAKGKMNLIPVVSWDVMTALNERGKSAPDWPYDDLILQPGPVAFQAYCAVASQASFVVVDLETPYTKGMDEEELEELKGQIDRASLAFVTTEGRISAITFPWQEPFIGTVRLLLRSGVTTAFWNGFDFDLLKLAEAGIEVAGKKVDVMWLWNFLRKTLPRGLGHVSTYYDRTPEWKSLGSTGDNAELYSAMDARQTAKILLGIKKVLEGRLL